MSLLDLENKPSTNIQFQCDDFNMKPQNSFKFPFRIQKNATPRNDSYIVTNLMAELALALNNKIKLEKENAHLKLECDRLTKTQLTLEKKILEEKSKCSSAISSFQEQLRSKNIQLKEQNVTSLEEVKNYLSQVTDLKTEIEKLKDVHARSINEMQDKLIYAENELSASKQLNNDLLEKIDLLKEKAVKYRNKFKFSVGLLQKMNSILQYFYQKRETTSKKCQTESIVPGNRGSGEPHKPVLGSQNNFSCDNIISELFFKPNPFSDNIETLFFTHHDFQRNVMPISEL